MDRRGLGHAGLMLFKKGLPMEPHPGRLALHRGVQPPCRAYSLHRGYKGVCAHRSCTGVVHEVVQGGHGAPPTTNFDEGGDRRPYSTAWILLAANRRLMASARMDFEALLALASGSLANSPGA
jgi:hypothetical protein